MGRVISAAVSLLLVAVLTSCGTSPDRDAVPSPLGSRLPLWPFASVDDATRWARDTEARASAAWHTDPAQTALRFTQVYLGFTGIDRATEVVADDDEATVSVGYALPNGRTATAAAVHLVRLGADADAPWEVVGTDDALLTVDAPAYGTTVDPVIDVGGSITGVDECIHLQVHQLATPSLVGEFSCRMAGGHPGRWAARVDAPAARSGVLTVVAWTGGAVADVQRFAVTAVRTP